MAVSPRKSSHARLARLRARLDADVATGIAVVLAFALVIAALVLSGALHSW